MALTLAAAGAVLGKALFQLSLGPIVYQLKVAATRAQHRRQTATTPMSPTANCTTQPPRSPQAPGLEGVRLAAADL